MTTSDFKYSVRLPFVARQVDPEWLGAKFLATLDALTQINSTIFPDWEIGDMPAMRGYPLAAARSPIAEIVSRNVSLTISIARSPSPATRSWLHHHQGKIASDDVVR